MGIANGDGFAGHAYAQAVTTHRRQRLATSDGRTITWLEFGDPGGSVVISHHGGLLSAMDVAPLDEVARSLGVRLVSFDRPGVSGSTPRPDRTTADGAWDAREVLDHLEIDQARALGWSMGGQYALATAAGLPDRILAAAMVAGCLPLDDPSNLAELNAMDRRFTAMAEHHQRALESVASVWGGLARFSPRAWAKAVAHGEVSIDAAAVRANAEALAASAGALSEQRSGIVEEYLAFARPWGFALTDVPCPVQIWQGSDDHLVPAAWAGRLVELLPNASLHPIDGEGHFLLLNRGAEVLAELVAT